MKKGKPKRKKIGRDKKSSFIDINKNLIFQILMNGIKIKSCLNKTFKDILCSPLEIAKRMIQCRE